MRAKLSVQVAILIRRLVEQGVYGPGDRLPTLAALAENFHCSRATVREALSILQGQGLVELHHGDGIYIRTAAMETWMQPLDAALLLAVEQLEQVVEVVLSVLAGAAGHLAQNRDSDTLRTLNQRLFQMECFGGKGEEAVSSELTFHLSLVEAAGNTLATNVVRVMEEAFRSCLRFANRDGALGLQTCQAVVEAISQGHSGAAREALFTYGDNIIRLLVWLRESSPDRMNQGPETTRDGWQSNSADL